MIYGLSPNVVDWALAVICGIPLLMAAVAYIVVWAEDRSESASTTGGRTTAPPVADGLPEPEARRGRR